MDRVITKIQKTVKSHKLTLTEDEFKKAIIQYVESKFAIKLPEDCFMYYDKAGGGCDNRYETDKVDISWRTEEYTE